MFDNQEDLYEKYSKFTALMLEEHAPLDIAAIMTIISLSMYKTLLDKEGFEKMIDQISNSRNEVKTLPGFSSGEVE
jgi:hypothetical protein